MNIPCRICMEFEQDGDVLRTHIEKYLRTLSEEEKIDEASYFNRLSLCEKCEALNQGLCKYCGCFVIVRAIKKRLNCPYPEGKRW
jgi:hypothetical protein